MQFAKRLLQVASLLLTWVALFFTLTFFTALVMAPWDTAVQIPEVGSWQRTLNDFFGYSAGQFLLSIPVVAIRIAIAWLTWRVRPHLLTRLILGNFLLTVTVWLVMGAASFINNQLLFPYPPVLYDPNYRGFHRSIFPMSVLLATCAAWFILQRRVGLPLPSLKRA